MATKIIMPALGMAQDTGILTAWLKQEGDSIVEGEPLMEIETDKTTVEVEAPASGVLAGVTVQPGDEVPVAQVIAWILAPGETLPAEAEAAPSIEPAAAEKPAVPPSASPVAARLAAAYNVDLNQVESKGDRITKAEVQAYIDARQDGSPGAPPARLLPASPKARRLAQERELEIASIQGSGPESAVLASDVLAVEPPAPAVARPAAEPSAPAMSQAWRVMAERLTQSWTSVPHFYLTREVDVSQLTTWREVAQKRTGEKITYTDLLIKIVAVALNQHPRLNASWDDGEIHFNERINIGLAVATDDGLIVPVIHDAGAKTLAQLAVERAGIVSRTLNNKLKLRDLQGGTFTISNLGMFGVDAFNAVVNPPQAAILAVGRIAERVVPVDGQPAVRPVMMLTLSLDHRVVDGARGAQFLDTVAGYIEEPLALI